MLRGWSAGVRIRNHVADSKWDDEEMLLLQSLIADELKKYEISFDKMYVVHPIFVALTA